MTKFKRCFSGPKDGDIGKKVWYSPPGNFRTDEDEEGVVVSWNNTFVFVRFGNDTLPKGCRRQDLWWPNESI